MTQQNQTKQTRQEESKQNYSFLDLLKNTVKEARYSKAALTMRSVYNSFSGEEYSYKNEEVGKAIAYLDILNSLKSKSKNLDREQFKSLIQRLDDCREKKLVKIDKKLDTLPGILREVFLSRKACYIDSQQDALGEIKAILDYNPQFSVKQVLQEYSGRFRRDIDEVFYEGEGK